MSALKYVTGYPVRTTTILKEYDESIDDTVFGVEFRCIRNPQHRMLVFFRCVDNVLIKIGQYPSVADLSESQIGQYRKLLGNEKYRELARAIGLKSHGVEVGAFIYLRRIFEDLI